MFHRGCVHLVNAMRFDLFSYLFGFEIKISKKKKK